MAVVGVDFGTLASKIGVARHRGIDIITNEVSNRATPSLVAFGPKQRHIGESAKTQETSNYKNTIGSLKRLAGRTLEDSDVQGVEKKFINAKLVDVDGKVGVQVNFRGEPSTYSSTQLVGMYLGKLRDTAATELKTGVTDIVIAVPGWFSDVQRRAVLDAAAIANLNVLRLINDTTASALGYGITKSDLPDETNPRYVVFVDIGHSDLSVSVVAFWKSNLKVLSAAYDRHLGGRDIDYALVQHFAKEFKGKYKIDVLSNPKATFRLAAGCEKIKKVLSANAEAPLNVESIMNDIDASGKLTREEYESILAPLFAKIPIPIFQAIQESGLTIDQIDSIELIGGSTRIPAVRTAISSCFPGKALSTTLNQDEAVARGATFACAMLSPVFRVKEFHMLDTTAYPVTVSWVKSEGDDDADTELVLFGHGNILPSTKVLTFFRTEGKPFSVDVSYAPLSKEHPLPGDIPHLLGRFTSAPVPKPPSSAAGEQVCIRVKMRLNQHGVVHVGEAWVEETEEREEPAEKMDVDPAAPAPAEGAAEGEAPPPPPKKKKLHKIKHPLTFTFEANSLPANTLAALKEAELALHSSDKLVMDTEDRKNALEEYIYDMRGKLDERYLPFAKKAEKEVLIQKLAEQEDWLYSEEGEDATKSAYVERLSSLQALGNPITLRFRENTILLRPAVSALRETLDLYESQSTTDLPQFDHIAPEEKQKVVEKVAEVRKWLEDQHVRQSERPKDEDPVLKSDEVSKKRDDIIYFVTPILSKPKPKVTPAPSNTGTPKPEETKEAPPKGATPEPGAQGPSEMDVD